MENVRTSIIYQFLIKITNFLYRVFFQQKSSEKKPQSNPYMTDTLEGRILEESKKAMMVGNTSTTFGFFRGKSWSYSNEKNPVQRDKRKVFHWKAT